MQAPLKSCETRIRGRSTAYERTPPMAHGLHPAATWQTLARSRLACLTWPCSVTVKDGGKALLQIQDNGHGVRVGAPVQASMAYPLPRRTVPNNVRVLHGRIPPHSL